MRERRWRKSRKHPPRARSLPSGMKWKDKIYEFCKTERVEVMRVCVNRHIGHLRRMFYSAGIWILNVASWLMSSIHECKASLLNYHIIAVKVCRSIRPRVAALTPSEKTLALTVIKRCSRTYFPCTIQTGDCQLLWEMGYLLASGGRTGSGNSEKKKSCENEIGMRLPL